MLVELSLFDYRAPSGGIRFSLSDFESDAQAFTAPGRALCMVDSSSAICLAVGQLSPFRLRDLPIGRKTLIITGLVFGGGSQSLSSHHFSCRRQAQCRRLDEMILGDGSPFASRLQHFVLLVVSMCHRNRGHLPYRPLAKFWMCCPHRV